MVRPVEQNHQLRSIYQKNQQFPIEFELTTFELTLQCHLIVDISGMKSVPLIFDGDLRVFQRMQLLRNSVTGKCFEGKLESINAIITSEEKNRQKLGQQQ